MRWLMTTAREVPVWSDSVKQAAANQAQADEGKIVGGYVAPRGEFGALSWLARMAFGVVDVAQVIAGHG